jgi:hypothetical protein
MCGACCVLSSRGLYVGLITRPKESDRVGVSESDGVNWVCGGRGRIRGCCTMKKERRVESFT